MVLEPPLVDDQALLDSLRLFATRSVEDYDVASVLDELGDEVCAVLGLDGAGVTLKVVQDSDEMKYISATNSTTWHVEQVQDHMGDGACFDAILAGRPVIAEGPPGGRSLAALPTLRDSGGLPQRGGDPHGRRRSGRRGTQRRPCRARSVESA